MAWVQPYFRKAEVDRAGDFFSKVTPDQWFREDFAGKYVTSHSVLSNFRSAHSFPLNAIQMLLRRRAMSLSGDAIVSQRLKRLESIRMKLQRFTTELSQVQDIGGCRAVMPTCQLAQQLASTFLKYEASHQFVSQKDYVENPKSDGYRSWHLMYRYRSSEEKTLPWDRLRIEIQIRSAIQHAWATAVEAVGIFTGQKLKSNEGDPEWRRFFALASSAFARLEKTPHVPGTPENEQELRDELEYMSRKLRVLDMVKAYKATIIQTNQLKKKAKWFVVRLNFNDRKLYSTRFPANQSRQAEEYMSKLETDYANDDNVVIAMLSADSINDFTKAYPNFVLDTSRFENVMSELLGEEVFPLVA